MLFLHRYGTNGIYATAHFPKSDVYCATDSTSGVKKVLIVRAILGHFDIAERVNPTASGAPDALMDNNFSLTNNHMPYDSVYGPAKVAGEKAEVVVFAKAHMIPLYEVSYTCSN